ncbi:MAG: hypothetical protein FJZ92_08185 [Chloroflexi bacterium]|nr:hypothetical protein [Chloroflexota bacterium]
MKKLAATLAVLLVGALLSISTAGATPPQSVSGDFAVVVLGPPDVEPAGKNCRVALDVAFDLAGAVEGAAVLTSLRIVRHGSCDFAGPAAEDFAGHGTFPAPSAARTAGSCTSTETDRGERGA